MHAVGFDQLCWHNFRITGTYLSGISIKDYSRTIGSGNTHKRVVWGVVYSIPHDRPNMSDQKGNPNTFYVIGHQNVPRHCTQENFPASAIG